MGAIPDLAPAGENHLLRSSSVVQKVSYGGRSVSYRTFDKASTEVLRLSFRPARVTAGDATPRERPHLNDDGDTLPAPAGGGQVVRVRHTKAGEGGGAGRQHRAPKRPGRAD